MQLLEKLSVQEAKNELARRNIADFVAATKPDYEFNWHHRVICDALDDFAHGKIKKLLIFAPPQHGKSELSTRRLASYLLGIDPKLRIAVVSYSASLATGFGLDIQRIIDDVAYSNIFTETKLSRSNISEMVSGYIRSKQMFETVPHRGGVRCVGVDGSLTGFPVDVAILDDLYKNRDQALSPAVQESVNSFWDSVLIPRLHNDSKILATFTRWAQDDIGGRFLKEGDWTVLNIPAVREEKTPTVKNDPRKIGEALWSKKHSLARLNKIKEDNPVIFNSLYQQQPSASKEVLVFPEFTIIDEFPKEYSSGCGIDFGFTNDPTAVINVAVHNRNLYLDEIAFGTRMLNTDIVTAMKASGVNIKSLHVADSAEPKSIAELQTLGLNVVPAVKGPDSVHFGLLDMQKMKLHVTKRSVNLIRELNVYQYRVVGGRITNEPIDANNHTIDAARYKFTHLNTKPKIRI